MLHNPYVMLALTYGLLLLFSLKGTIKSFGKIDTNQFLSYDNTDCIKGIAIVFVMYSHYIALFNVNYLWTSVGDIGVSIFFLFSGYGLMSSKVKKENYLKGFLPSKSIRIIAPFIVSFALAIPTYLLFKIDISSNLFVDFFTLSLPNSLNWYLKVQIIMYVLFWLFSLILKNKHYFFIGCLFVSSIIFIVIGVITDMQWFWYQNVLFFPTGMLVALHKDKIFKTISNHYWFALGAGLILFGMAFASVYFVGGSVFLNIFFLTAVVILFMIINAKTQGNSKSLRFLGKHSIELYLTHLIVLSILNKFDGTHILLFFPFIIISIALSILVKCLSNLIIKGFNHIFKITK